MNTNASDEDLHNAVLQRDQIALSQLVSRYGPLLRSAARKHCNEDDVDDAVSETWAKYWEHPERYRSSMGKLSTWLHTIASNQATDTARSRLRKKSIAASDTRSKRTHADGLACPKCGSFSSSVRDSRWSRAHNAWRRRRECSECGSRYSTYEVLEAQLARINTKKTISVEIDGRKVWSGEIEE